METDKLKGAALKALDKKPEQMVEAEKPAVHPLASVIPPVPARYDPEFSIITCSISDDKFKAMSGAYAVALTGATFEIIRIGDARGLAEGYLRGLSQASGKYIIFSHDDAAPLRPIAAKLRGHLRRVDIVGGCGTRRLDGPAWFTAGPPYTVGQVLNQMAAKDDRTGKIVPIFALTVYGIPNRLVKNVQAIDGFWMACNRRVLHPQGAWFDMECCPGFHGYDVDFSFSAYQRGIRIGVACDLSLCHASTGGYGDPLWKPHADKLEAKHGKVWSQHLPNQWQFSSVQGLDQQQMLGVMDEFCELASEE